MTELNIPDTAKKGATSRILGLLRATDMTGSRKDVANDILISLDRYVAEAVAAELERLAEGFDADAFDGLLGNQAGATLAIVTAEVYEAAAERLRDRAAELRDGA